jgi:hypothetical protein
MGILNKLNKKESEIKTYEFPKGRVMAPHRIIKTMEHFDVQSIKLFCLTIFLFIWGDITLSDAALYFTILAGATTAVRNITGDSLQSLFMKAVNKIKNRKRKL